MIETTEAYGLSFAFPASDTAVGACLRDHGEFARPELDFFLAHADAPSGAFVDVGANLGAISLPFAAKHAGWQIVAVEAFYAMARLLQQNATANGLSNVEVLAVAAGAEAGVGEFPAAELRHGGNFGSLGFYTTEIDLKRRVGVRPLDDFAPPETRLVKIDVEGYEPEVLKGARHLLKTQKALWLIEAHPADVASVAEVRSVMVGAGYRLFWFLSPFATPLAPKRAPAEPGRADFSFVALPPGVENRWRLPPVIDGAPPPRAPSAFPYLARYGY